MSNAQNQHYIPKFILRQFLVDKTKEQVSVYDKQTDRIFKTSIKNIMAERRYNDFSFTDYIISFEGVVSKIEDLLIPAYRKVLEQRRLEYSPQEKTDLALLIAFQFLRTKHVRSAFSEMEEQTRSVVEGMGYKMSDIKGWEPLTEDILKRQSLLNIQKSLPVFLEILAQKDFLLFEPSEERNFYLGDNPVCLNNSNDYGIYGSLGLAVKGIEIYLPLSHDLLLCAWCPSILAETKVEIAKFKTIQSQASIEYLKGSITLDQYKEVISDSTGSVERAELLMTSFEEGIPLKSSSENMDFYNSMQTAMAGRYVICQDSDFDLAQRHNKEFPELRKGRRLKW